MTQNLFATLTLTTFCLTACGTEAPANTDDSTTSGSSSSSSGGEECWIGERDCRCTDGGGCDRGLVCEAGTCVDDEMSTTTGTSTSTTGSTTDMTTTGSSTGDPLACDANLGLINPDCPEELPYCKAGLCGDCASIFSCAEVDQDNPICDIPSGECVECTEDNDSACEGATPICDTMANICVGCSDHGECPNSSCDIETGACMDPEKVLYIFTDTGKSNNCTDMKGLGGTFKNPYCVFNIALEHAMNNGGLDGWTFKMLPGAPYAQPKVVLESESPFTVAIIADQNASDAADFSSVYPSVDTTGDITLYLHNLDFESGATISDNPTLLCRQGARLHISHSQIRGGAGPGLRGEDCNITLNDSVVTMNKSEGIEMSGGSLVMSNTFVTNNGHPGSKYGGGGLSLSGVGVDMVYTTIVDNMSPDGVDSIHCNDVVGGIENSIITHNPASPNQSVDCPGLIINHSLVDEAGETGDENQQWDSQVILSLLEGGNGIYRILNEEAQAMIQGIALWTVWDPSTDFEGDPRPKENGAADTPGADVLPL